MNIGAIMGYVLGLDKDCCGLFVSHLSSSKVFGQRLQSCKVLERKTYTSPIQNDAMRV